MRKRHAALITIAICLAACSSDSTTNGPLFAGTYRATTFRVTPPGQSEKDVLAAGGSLSITITATGVTTGSLNIPASVTGDSALVEDMAGMASLRSNLVTFDQGADTFVRDLAWAFSADGLSVMNETAGGATYNILLTRQ